MKAKYKIGTDAGAGTLYLDNDLTLVESVHQFFRSKIRAVSELSDGEFLSMFDVPAVSALMNSGYNLRSTSALIDHFRSRVESDWLKAPPQLVDLGFNTNDCTEAELLARAEQVLNYDLEWSGVPPELSASGEVDWQTNVLGNAEWLARINRHSWWPLLGLAYQRTGDERYAMAFARQLSTWISYKDNCDTSDEIIWSCKQVALRLRVSWIPAFGMFFNSPYFNTARKLEMLRTIFDQARFLKRQKTNDNLVYNGGLVCAGISFPEVRESKAWRKTAIDRCWVSLRSNHRHSDKDGGDLRYSSNLLAFSDRELAAAS